MRFQFLFILLFSTSLCVNSQSLDINSQNQGDMTEQKDSVGIQVSVGSEKPSVKKNVRNFIKEGNKLFREQHFADAEVKYKKALELDPNSEYAQFNLATTLIKQSGNVNPSDETSPANEAVSMFENLIKMGQTQEIVEKSYFNLGNIAYNSEQYAQSIEYYKNALRKNPSNDLARDNLRLAQLKLQEQQQNQNNQNQQEQEKQQQEQQKKQEQQQQQQQQQQEEQSSMSDSNAEKILRTMENEEAKTRKRLEAQKAREQNSRHSNNPKPW